MKRAYKNIINISISIILIAALGCTCYFGSKASNTFSSIQINQTGGFNPNTINNQTTDGSSSDTTDGSTAGATDETTPPEMPSGDATTDGSTTQPTIPSGGMNNGGGQMPGNMQGNMQGGPSMNGQTGSDSTTPPEMPSGDATTDGSTVQPTMPSTDSSTTPPEIPSGDSTTADGSTIDGSTTQPTMPSDLPSGMETTDLEFSSELDTTYKVLIIIESIGITLSLAYLFMTKFNSISFKEAFANKDTLIISTLLCVVVCAGLSYGAITLTNNYISSNTPDFSQTNGNNFFDQNKNMDFSEKV